MSRSLRPSVLVPPALAIGCLALALVEVAAGKWPPATPIAVAWATASAVPVAFLRTHPVAAWLAFQLVLAPLDPVLGQPQSGALFFETAALLVGVGAFASSRRRQLFVAATVVGNSAELSFVDPSKHTTAQRLDELGPTVVLFLIFLAVGLAIGWRSRRSRAAQVDVDVAHAESRAAVTRAVADERSRIARDLHDVVAHSVSLMVVQAVGGRGMLTRQPTRALDAFDAIDRAGAQAMIELDRMVDVLSDPEPAEDLPGLAHLQRITDAADGLGAHVRLEVDGPVERVPPGIGVAAYRIVQEAVTNAVKHATGEAIVRVRAEPTRVVVEVENPLGPPVAVLPGAGYGLLGMRERAELYDGSLDAGRRDDRWQVRAVIPLARQVVA